MAIKRIRVHNFYVPAGGDEPDTGRSMPKFGHKLDFIEEMKAAAGPMRSPGVSSMYSSVT